MVPGMRRPNSGLPEFVNIENQRCHSRLGWDRSRIYFSPTVRLALYIDYVSRALQVSRSVPQFRNGRIRFRQCREAGVDYRFLAGDIVSVNYRALLKGGSDVA
jgi:hypothetical protein